MERAGAATKGEKPAEPTRAVDRALRLLEVLAGSDVSLSLMDGARKAGLPVSTASRLLRSLESAGFAVRGADGRYLVGGRFLKVAATALTSRPYLRAAHFHLEELTKATGESSYLAVADESRALAIYVQQVPSPHAIRHWDGLGRTVPLRGTAVGSALRGCTGPGGYALKSGGVEPDVTAVAAPVRWLGEIVAALSVVGPTFRMTDRETERVGRLVVAHAAEISSASPPGRGG